MIRQLHWAASILMILPVIAEANSGIIQVTGLRSWSHPGSTRVIIEISGPAEYHADRAHDPERLFFDVLHARPLINGRRIASKEINDGLVKRVRIAETAPGTTRVVFDLSGQVDYTVSTLDAPDRLVVELTSTRGTARPVAPAVSSRMLSSPVLSSIAPAPQQMMARSSSRHRVLRPFVPPVLPRPVARVISLPDAMPAIDPVYFEPYQISESWYSLANIRAAPKRPVIATVNTPFTPPPPAPFINTTTKVLPAVHPAAANSVPKASTDASLSLTRALGLKINRIVIDAGHGGHDDGTIGPNGVLEKDVVLDVALRLATLVQTRLGAEVVLTRSDDTFVPLTERTAIANDHKADLFLSIHANSSPAPEVAGTETFLLNLNSSPGALSVAARENAGSDKSVGELRDLIQSIAQNDKIAESQNFATDIQSAIFAQAVKGNTAAHDRGVKKAPFVVLIGARMPSVLAEIGFLSNPRDESNLNKAEYRQKVAESLYRGLAQYSQSLSHFEVANTTTTPASKPLGYSGTGSK